MNSCLQHGIQIAISEALFLKRIFADQLYLHRVSKFKDSKSKKKQIRFIKN